MLISRDEQSCLVVSYKEVKSCIESAFKYVLSISIRSNPDRFLHRTATWRVHHLCVELQHKNGESEKDAENTEKKRVFVFPYLNFGIAA